MRAPGRPTSKLRVIAQLKGGVMGAVRTSVVIGVLALCSAWPVSASPPAPWNSTAPAHITLVGTHAGAPDALGSFTVIVRSISNNPLPNRTVDIDLSGCTDLEICSDQLDPAASVDCAAKRVQKVTDSNGRASFTILGGSNGSNHATTLQGGAKIYAQGILLASSTASALDLDGVNGVAINDLSVWLSDFGAPGNPPFGRSDFDGSGTIDVNDLSLWITAYGAGGSVQSCTTSCP
jgi:hypothetical protein